MPLDGVVVVGCKAIPWESDEKSGLSFRYVIQWSLVYSSFFHSAKPACIMHNSRGWPSGFS